MRYPHQLQRFCILRSTFQDFARLGKSQIRLAGADMQRGESKLRVVTGRVKCQRLLVLLLGILVLAGGGQRARQLEMGVGEVFVLLQRVFEKDDRFMVVAVPDGVFPLGEQFIFVLAAAGDASMVREMKRVRRIRCILGSPVYCKSMES